jgi:hypothetical protein
VLTLVSGVWTLFLLPKIDLRSLFLLLEWMEHLGTARGEAAALRAATESQSMDHSIRGLGGGQSAGGPISKQGADAKYLECLESMINSSLTPLFWLGECFLNVIGKRLYHMGSGAHGLTRRHGRLFLSGMKPYSCSIKVTAVNILVGCNLWYMFIDQARLAFFPPRADDSLAIASLYVLVACVSIPLDMPLLTLSSAGLFGFYLSWSFCLRFSFVLMATTV